MAEDESLEYLIGTGTISQLSSQRGKGKRIEGFVKTKHDNDKKTSPKTAPVRKKGPTKNSRRPR